MPTGKTMTADEFRAALARLEETIPGMDAAERKKALDKRRYYRRQLRVLEARDTMPELEQQLADSERRWANVENELAVVKERAVNAERDRNAYRQDRDRYMKKARFWRQAFMFGMPVAVAVGFFMMRAAGG